MVLEQEKIKLAEAYVLELLPPAEAGLLTARLQTDEELQRAVSRERRVAELVRGSLQTAVAPNPARLRALMPPPPARRRFQAWSGIGLRRQLAGLALVALLAFGAMSQMWPVGERQVMPGGLAATATETIAPTATMTATTTAQAQQILPDAAPFLSEKPQPRATPKAVRVPVSN
jgi:anti-sigma-K factor RskA